MLLPPEEWLERLPPTEEWLLPKERDGRSVLLLVLPLCELPKFLVPPKLPLALLLTLLLRLLTPLLLPTERAGRSVLLALPLCELPKFLEPPKFP